MATSKVVAEIIVERDAWRKRRQGPRVIEGIACSYGTDPHWDVMPSGEPGGTPVHAALKRLDGKRVRVTIEVLPPEGTAE